MLHMISITQQPPLSTNTLHTTSITQKKTSYWELSCRLGWLNSSWNMAPNRERRRRRRRVRNRGDEEEAKILLCEIFFEIHGLDFILIQVGQSDRDSARICKKFPNRMCHSKQNCIVTQPQKCFVTQTWFQGFVDKFTCIEDFLHHKLQIFFFFFCLHSFFPSQGHDNLPYEKTKRWDKKLLRK